jgi:toxin ParE1/3/4
MTPSVHRAPSARADLVEIADYLAQRSEDLSDSFLAAVEQSLATAAQMPGLGNPCEFANPELQGVRTWPVRGFKKYTIFYRPVEGGIEVLRVLHGSRDITSLFGG